MANIYEEKNETLYRLLERACADNGATVLVPDLQRPYVWTPNQVSLLIDSLIRGWPFGTLLMWRVSQGELHNIPHRQFCALWSASLTAMAALSPGRIHQPSTT